MSKIGEGKINEARQFLKAVGMPATQHNERSAYTLLALANLKPTSDWSEATNEWIRIAEIRDFLENTYKKVYAMNSRETIRKQTLHQFRDAALIEDAGEDTNSPNYSYRLTKETLELVRTITTEDFESSLAKYLANHEKLVEIYRNKKEMKKMSVLINSEEFKFSPGAHNELQKAILEEFAPRFAPNSECLYVGDTIKKDLVNNVKKLKELGFEITLHDKIPDVILYREDKNWIYFIESVTSVGPMSQKRVNEINQMTENVKSGKVFVTAFQDFKTYKKFSLQLAWETEVWLSAMPDHMIHLNGDRFLGPR